MENPPSTPWTPTHKLRMTPSQKYFGPHEKESPRSIGKKRDKPFASERSGSVFGRERSKNAGTRGRTPARGKDGTVSTRERSNTFGGRDGVSASDKDGTNSNRERSNTFTFGTGDDYPGGPIQPLPDPGYGLLDDEGVIRKDFGSWNPPNKQESHHDPRPHSPKPDHSIDETSDRENQAVSDLGQNPEETETLSKTPHSSHNKERDSLDSQPRPSGSPTLINARPTHDPVEEQFEEAPDSTRSPDTMKKEDAHPIDELVEEQVEEAPDSTHFPDTTKKEDARTIHNPVEEQVDLGKDMNNEAPDSTHSHDTTENDDQDIQLMSDNGKIAFSQPTFTGSGHVRSPVSQLGSPGIGPFENPHSQPNSARNDQSESLDSQTQSPMPGGYDVEMSPIRTEVKAWLNSPSDLPSNYWGLFSESSRSPSPERSSSSSSYIDSIHTGSLIVSPTLSDEQLIFEEEENPWVSRANVELFARHRANFPLRSPSEDSEAADEQGAEAATDRQNGGSRRRRSWLSSISSGSSVHSLLLSPDRDDLESPINRENVPDDVAEAKEEAAEKATLNLIELYRANFELQTQLELKEANFKREIQIAWKHPRPPPTTSEQRADKRALEKIESMNIFDEIGDQQRPIRTDPQMVLWETRIDIMITRARTNYLLEDFPKMYTHANRAVAAASQLRFPPLTAMCCYFRGMASYHHREFAVAKVDFEEARGCAGFYGISSEVIEKHIDLIDRADDPATAVLERFPAPRSKAIVRMAKRTTNALRRTEAHSENDSLPSPADDATTLVEGSPRIPEDTALPLPPSSSLLDEEHSIGQSNEDADSQPQTLRRPSPLGKMPLDSDPQPGTDDDVPNYKPQEEAISEEIRKSIFESKAQSLDPVSEAGPTEANAQEKKTLSPPSMASTEWTLLGSTTSQGTMRRVPRPYIAPINTSLATVRSKAVRETSVEANADESDSDEMDEDEIMAAFNTKRDDATPDTA